MKLFCTPPNIDKIRFGIPIDEKAIRFEKFSSEIKEDGTKLFRVHRCNLEVQYWPMQRRLCFEFSPPRFLYGNNMIPFKYGVSAQYEAKILDVIQSYSLLQSIPNQAFSNRIVTDLDLNYDFAFSPENADAKNFLVWLSKLYAPRLQIEQFFNDNISFHNKTWSFTGYDKQKQCKQYNLEFLGNKEVIRTEIKCKSPFLKTEREKGNVITFRECLDNPEIAKLLWDTLSGKLLLLPNVLNTQEMDDFIRSLGLRPKSTQTLHEFISFSNENGLNAMRKYNSNMFYKYRKIFLDHNIAPIPWDGCALELFDI